MTAPTDAGMPGDVGLPSEETIADLLQTLSPIGPRCRSIAARILDLTRPAFEAKDQRIRQLALLLDKQLGAPCEQIRHQQEVEALARAVEAGFREGWMAGEHEGRAYGFTGKLSDNPDRAWNKSKSNRLLRARSASRGETA